MKLILGKKKNSWPETPGLIYEVVLDVPSHPMDELVQASQGIMRCWLPIAPWMHPSCARANFLGEILSNGKEAAGKAVVFWSIRQSLETWMH
jgi:hypothetical protein